MLEHHHVGLGGLFLPSVLSPPTQQTSHRPWRAPAGAGGGSPWERPSEEKPTSLPIASVRTKLPSERRKYVLSALAKPWHRGEADFDPTRASTAAWGRDQPRVPLPEQLPLPAPTAGPAPAGGVAPGIPVLTVVALSLSRVPGAGREQQQRSVGMRYPPACAAGGVPAPGQGDTRGISSSHTETGREGPLTAGPGRPGS